MRKGVAKNLNFIHAKSEALFAKISRQKMKKIFFASTWNSLICWSVVGLEKASREASDCRSDVSPHFPLTRLESKNQILASVEWPGPVSFAWLAQAKQYFLKLRGTFFNFCDPIRR